MNDNLEKEVGICSYISDHNSFFAIIKQRFSDFHVNEITSSGEIVHFTNEKVIPIPTLEKPNVTDKPPEITDEEVEKLKLLSGEKSCQKSKPTAVLIRSESGVRFKMVDTDEKDIKQIQINVNDLTKKRRAAVHIFIKSQFPSLNSMTKDVGGSKFICVTKKENVQKKDRRNSWPALQRYVTFVMYKENIDTMDAVNYIAGKLRLRSNVFAYAGTKDRRAKTSQLVSVLQVSPQNISASVAKIKKIKVGNFTFGKKPQVLGQACGNHFRIALREVEVSDEDAEKGLASLREKGFINYYGMQRFSCSNVLTHSIGRAILQGKMDEAVDLILSPRDNDSSNILEAKQIWNEKRDPSLALKSLKHLRKNTVEGQLLSGLADHGSTNYVNALERIPRNMNLMYIHAYQSYIWNNVLSRRLEKYKLEVLLGDLIRTRSFKRIFSSQKDSTCEEIGSNEINENCNEDEEQLKCDEKTAHVLTSEEAKSVDITDVILPLPGYNIIYPNNEIKEWYQELLEKDNLSFDKFKNKVKTFSLGGSYRAIIVRPQKVEHSICFYDDPTLPLIPSDLDILENNDVLANRLKCGKYKALLLEFSLPTSCYATMVLRELLKIETSSKYQSALNDRSKAKEESTADTNTDSDTRTTSVKRTNNFDDNSTEKKIKV